jgi:beta-aspartyl-peptidase (threonine type)
MEPVVVIHGGAWAIPDCSVEASLLGVQVAARAAWNILTCGGSALDAVEAAVISLENDPVFDAGTGAVLTSDGTVELDAMIMEGKDLRCGAVACVQVSPTFLSRQMIKQ